MLNLQFIRENAEAIKKDLDRRRDEEKKGWVDQVVALDKRARELMQDSQKLRAKRNELTKEINELKKAGNDASGKLEEAKGIPGLIKSQEAELEEIQVKIKGLQMRIPNMMHESVPYGKDDSENVEIKRWGEPKVPPYELISHGEFMEQHGLGDFSRSAKVSGTGFYFLKGELALLNQSLIRYAIDLLTSRGYTLIEPPLMMKREAYEGVTSLDDFENVMYKIDGEDMYLIATSEHPMGAMYKDEAIDESDLPIRFAGYSMCFRREIGSHGVDTRGLFRTHQFNKVEQFIFCLPEDSWKLHEELLKNSEDLFQGLGLPYRVVNICTGDLGIIASKKYDLEVWMPRQKAYKEACSCSNCTAYQAVRLNIKVKRKDGTKEYLHTLNNTAVATGRALVAVIENYQNEDGSITVPPALRPYMGGKETINQKK